MAEVDTIITRFEVEADRAVEDVKRFATQLDQTRKAADVLPSAALKADQAMSSLGERMKIFAREERAEGRTASFFVSQLGAIAPKGTLAADVLGELTQVLVGGAGLGLAFGAVGLATRLVTDAWEKQEKAAKELQEATKKLAQEHAATYEAAKKTADEAAEALRKAQFMAKGGLDLDYRVIAAINARAEAEKHWAEVKKKSDEAKSQGKVAFSDDEWNTEKARLKAAIDAEKAVLVEKEAFVKAFEKDARETAAKEKAQADADEWASAWRFQMEEAARLTAAEKAAGEAKKAERERASRELAEMDQAAAEAKLSLEDDRITGELEMERQANAERVRMQEEFATFAQDAAKGLAQDFMSQFKPILTTSAAYSKAMKAQGKDTQGSADLSAAAFAALTQNMLASMSIQAATKAVFQMAEGFAMASVGNEKGAALAFASAGYYAAVSGIAAAGALTIGQTRGMTRAERESLAGMEEDKKPPPWDTKPAPGSGGTQTITKTETVFVIGDPFESPAETARRAARAMDLARRLDLVRRGA